MLSTRREVNELMTALATLHASAGRPDDRQLETYASLAGHQLSRSTANMLRHGRGNPRWETVEAYIAACRHFADRQHASESIPPEYFDISRWQALYEKVGGFRAGNRSQKSQRHRAVAVRLPRSPHSPARLLDPENGVVEFIGRVAELNALLEWCADDTAERMRLLTGPGGIGKTRLALQLAKMLAERGWRCEWLGDRQETRLLSDIRAADNDSLFLIVDYAETRIGLEELIRAVAVDDGPIRVLLLARSAGQWWEQLAAGEGAVRDLVLNAGSAGVPLGEILDDQLADEDAILRAVPAFASALGVVPPEYVEVATQSRPARALELHAAALVAVLDWIDDPYQPPQVSLDGVLEELLRHEEHFWLGSARAQSLQVGSAGLTNAQLRQMIAVGCLLGASDQDEAVALLRRVRGVPASEKLAVWLRELYPPGHGSKDWLGAMQPDRLAERFIVGQLSESETLARACLTELDERQARRAILLLARAATGDIGAERLLRRLLPLAAKVVEDIDAPLGTLVSIANAIPYPSVALGTAHSVITRRILAFPETNSHPVAHAYWLRVRGLTLSQLGRPREALTLIQRAVDLYRNLVSDNSGRYSPNLAASLTNLGTIYSDIGRSDDALSVAEESASLYRDLAAVNPGRYQIPLTAALTKLGERYAELGRTVDALSVTGEATNLVLELASAHPESYEAEAAFTLNHFGARLSEASRAEEALKATRRAVDLYRRLASANPDRYKPDLASAMAQLGARYSVAGWLADAAAVTLEATGLVRDLFLVNPDQYRSDMARYLASLGGQFRDQGRLEEALGIEREAITLYRTLEAGNPGSHQPELAAALSALGNVLAGLSRGPEALAATQESVGLYRHLATMNPEKYLFLLGNCLTILAARLSDLGRVNDALISEEEAVELYRKLAADADRYQPCLALALMVLGARYAQLGRTADALAVERSALHLYRRLAQADPARYRPNLALGLLIIGTQLSLSGRSRDALPPELEAVDLYRDLATEYPRLYRNGLAACLTNLSFRLSDLDRPAEALAVTQEAATLYAELVGNEGRPEILLSRSSTALETARDPKDPVPEGVVSHYRSLAATDPGRYRPDLALSLIGLQTKLSELDSPAEALAEVQEAVDLYRELSTADPDWYHPNLALSIRILGAMLAERGRHAEALAAEQEAVDLYRELAAESGGAYRTELAASLTKLGRSLSDNDRAPEALAATQEAVTLYQGLMTKIGRYTAQPGSAATITPSTDSGNPGDQAPAAYERVALYRTLAAVNPGRHRPALAKALFALGRHLLDASMHHAAISALEEAVDLYEELVNGGKERYQTDLVIAQIDYQQAQSKLTQAAIRQPTALCSQRSERVGLVSRRHCPRICTLCTRQSARSPESLICDGVHRHLTLPASTYQAHCVLIVSHRRVRIVISQVI